MTQAALHVLVLYDLPENTSAHANSDYLLNHSDRPTERDVCRAIKKLGMQLSVYGVYDDVGAIAHTIERLNPDVIFNLCETFRGDRSHEGHVAGVIELTGIPMTGSRSDALNLCKDKAITKKILGYDGIRVPKFSLIRQENKLEQLEVPFPVIVKPLNREASEGIAQASVVYDLHSCIERVQYIHTKLASDAIVEEFVHGREIYVGVIETVSGVTALPPRELFMNQLRVDQVMIATYQAKWNEEYRRRWGVQTAKAGPLAESTRRNLIDGSIKIFKALGMNGYARMDWRIDRNGDAVFLESNPNPALAQDDDFAKSAKASGRSYQKLILDLILIALPQREVTIKKDQKL